jgi:hypothetical protein
MIIIKKERREYVTYNFFFRKQDFNPDTNNTTGMSPR